MALLKQNQPLSCKGCELGHHPHEKLGSLAFLAHGVLGSWEPTSGGLPPWGGSGTGQHSLPAGD